MEATGMESSRTVLDLEDTSRTKIRGLGLGLGLEVVWPWPWP